MRYLGGKTQISQWVAKNVLAVAHGRTHYVEPFVGSGATFARIAPHFPRATALDAHPDLILMWRALAAGWNPPEYVSRAEYERLKREAPSALRGLVGFGSSWNGIWFSQYVDVAKNCASGPFMRAARGSVMRLAPAFRRAEIRCADYRELVAGPGMLIYCDPPYAGTAGYDGCIVGFDSGSFWEKADEWTSAGALVIVSEERAPTGWDIFTERERRGKIRATDRLLRREALFWKTPPEYR